MKTTEKKIGRREFYLRVARSVKCDMNPLQTNLRAALKILAGYDDATILRLVRGK